MPTTDNDALNTPEMVAERARLDAVLLADSVRLKELDLAISRLEVDRVRARVRFGIALEQRLAITPHGEQGAYVRSMEPQWGFDERKARDNRYYAALHQYDPEQFSIDRLSLLPVQQVRAEYQIHLGNDREEAGEIANRRHAQAIDNTVDMAVLTQARMNQADLRRTLQCQQQGWRHPVYQRWISAFIFRRGTPLTEEERTKVFVDSGAYTASTQGIDVNLDEFCTRLIENPSLTTYANLDYINHADPEDGAVVSYRNFQHMRSRGLDPIPVVHAGENISWLEKYIHEEGCDYVALGGVAGTNSTIQRNWAFFDKCFRVIDNAGRPIKVHAFGVAEEATLLNFDVASADSASWLLKAQKFGSTDISRLGDGEWRASIYKEGNSERRYAARTYLEAYDANRLERQIRETRPFDFYLVVPKADNTWWLPALWVVHHRNALVANKPDWDPALILRFIDDPLSVLAEPRFAAKLALLEEMKALHINNLYEQRRLQRERDRHSTAAPSAVPSLAD